VRFVGHSTGAISAFCEICWAYLAQSLHVVRFVGHSTGVISAFCEICWAYLAQSLHVVRFVGHSTGAISAFCEIWFLVLGFWSLPLLGGRRGRSPPARRPNENVSIARPVRVVCSCGHQQTSLGLIHI